MIQRMDNVLIVVEDIDAAKTFFAGLGMEVEGETTVEGPWVDQTVGLNNVRADIIMMRTSDGHGGVELTKFHRPAAIRTQPERAPANALGMRRIMFMVDDLDDVVDRLRGHGAELVGEIAQYEDIYRLCFLRGPEGIIVGLSEQLKAVSVGGLERDAIGPKSAKELVLELAPGWTEEQCERALVAAEGELPPESNSLALSEHQNGHDPRGGRRARVIRDPRRCTGRDSWSARRYGRLIPAAEI